MVEDGIYFITSMCFYFFIGHLSNHIYGCAAQTMTRVSYSRRMRKRTRRIFLPDKVQHVIVKKIYQIVAFNV
jgi:hypothetical protein